MLINKCRSSAKPRSSVGALVLAFGRAFALTLTLTLSALVWAQPDGATGKDPVGDVTLVIGSVQVQRGERQLSLQKGAPLMAGDSIQTQANGHAHLRFVDGALVSVRPASSLKIVASVNLMKKQSSLSTTCAAAY